MAFCEKCGKQLADGEQCTCSAPVEQPAAAKESIADSIKTKLPLIAAAAVVLVVIGLIVSLTGKGYMKPVNDLMSAFNKKTTNSVKIMTALMPDFGAKRLDKAFDKALKSDDVADSLEDANEELEDFYEDSVDDYGKWKLTFEKKSAKKMDKDDLEEIQEYFDSFYKDNLKSVVKEYEKAMEDEDDLEEYADDLDMKEKDVKAFMKACVDYFKAYEEPKVTAGYEVKGKFIIEGEREFKSDTVKFMMIKINGDWAYYGIDGDKVYFEDDYEGHFSIISSILNESQVIVDISF